MKGRFSGIFAATLATLVATVLSLVCTAGVSIAFDFDMGNGIKGAIDSQVTQTFGVRLTGPSSDMVESVPGAPGTMVYSNADNGDLNYHAGQLFNFEEKFTSEMLLYFPDQLSFMVRGTGFIDEFANKTDRTPLERDAQEQTCYNFRLLDLWGAKQFDFGGQTARLRVGNQVINWGETIFALGGINSTNALDVQRLLTPGTQLKEAVLPAPMIDFTSGLGHGLNVDMYYQFLWNEDRFPAVGSYFSTSNLLGYGRTPIFIDPSNPNVGGPDNFAFPGYSFPVGWAPDQRASSQGQGGLCLHYSPPQWAADFGLYFMNYHDKSPVLDSLNYGAVYQQVYLENRQLYGASMNFPLGSWAVGTELSYRPHDAISLSSPYTPGGPLDLLTNSSSAPNVPLWKDEQKYELDVTGLLSLTPSGTGGALLRLLRADTATLTLEGTTICYPDLSNRIYSTVNGIPVMQAPAAGYYTWLAYNSGSGYPIGAAVGTKWSGGITEDFNWVYDGTIIKEWQVNPGCTFFFTAFGNTPNATGNFLAGDTSINVYVNFIQNPPKWQITINYTKWMGGTTAQPLADRDMIGGFVTYNF
ncbi:MAG: DUF1302 family protein [Syntrophobacteraceae bacterium]|nr:DUF1302 family protein [Syntrophobacteraceae bacterium]